MKIKSLLMGISLASALVCLPSFADDQKPTQLSAAQMDSVTSGRASRLVNNQLNISTIVQIQVCVICGDAVSLGQRVASGQVNIGR